MFVEWVRELSQTEVARRVGVEQPSVFAWYHGRCKPRARRRAKIEKLGGIPRESWDERIAS